MQFKPNAKGELKITDLQNWYLRQRESGVDIIKGEWIDVGTFDSLLQAQIFAKKMQNKMII